MLVNPYIQRLRGVGLQQIAIQLQQIDQQGIVIRSFTQRGLGETGTGKKGVFDAPVSRRYDERRFKPLLRIYLW